MLYFVGLFEQNHMQYELERDKSGKGEPSLAEMTKKAIQVLQTNDNGFFLLVEGNHDHDHVLRFMKLYYCLMKKLHLGHFYNPKCKTYISDMTVKCRRAIRKV